MAYGHAERNLALIRQLEAETASLLDHQGELDTAQAPWVGEADKDITRAPCCNRETPAAIASPPRPRYMPS
jgi:hypothetical protein